MTHRVVNRCVRTALTIVAVMAAIASADGALAAPSAHSHEDILAVVEGAALQAAYDQGLNAVEVRVRPLDARLRPAHCDRELEVVRPHSGRALGPVSYGVRCSGSTPWTLYLRAEVSASMQLPVLARALPRGALLGTSDIEMVTRRITRRAAEIILDPQRAIGMELKRPLPAGSELRHGQMALPELVVRGQTVTLVAGGDGFEVRMQGKAMSNGAEGDRLTVTNLASGRRVEGLVLSDGSVRIPR